MNDDLNVILDYLKDNSYITTAKANDLGIKKHKIAHYAKQGYLQRSFRGTYILRVEDLDVHEVFQSSSSKIIYSYMTALYLHGLVDDIPDFFDISLPQGYNASRIKKRENTHIHYVKKELHELGKEVITTSKGKEITVYDKERCICDLIKNKNSIDDETFSSVITVYFKSKDANIDRLKKYAEYMKIENKVKQYIEIL